MSVTVVIPVHGRAALTRHCLDALFAGPLPSETRVLVVDDASPDETPAMLAAYRPTVEVIRHEENLGFAAACNHGVAAADTPYVLLLNNDTKPEPGWLGTLVDYAARHPGAGAVGARLLYPDGSVQHAGVVVGQDRLPHHAYLGFPGDHPAVVRSRQFQIVSGACLLLRRDAFLEVGAFDTAYRNGHEDVDLCLRLGLAGYEVHYCADAVLVHLESASRGRGTSEAAANGRRYLESWRDRVRPDDLEIYADDGLISLSYDGDLTPLRVELSPLLATLERRQRAQEVEKLLRTRAQQVNELLQDAIRLTVIAAETTSPGTLAAGWWRGAGAPVPAAGVVVPPELLLGGQTPILDREDAVQAALGALHRALADRLGDAFLPNPQPGYRRLVRQVRAVVEEAVPPGATVVVLSRGDSDLLDFGGRRAWHFPRDPSGCYAGFHLADSPDAVAHLIDLQRQGATHLVVPATAAWWLDHYRGFAEHLEQRHRRIAGDGRDCYVYELRAEETA